MQIDRNIPLPKPQRASKPSKYPWSEMEIGDSFMVEGKTTAQMSGRVRYAEKTTGFAFTSRSVEGGCRIWRVNPEDRVRYTKRDPHNAHDYVE
jgi:hypothetical protein